MSIEEVRVRDRLARLNKQHALFLTRSRSEEQTLLQEQAKFEAALQKLEGKIEQRSQKHQALSIESEDSRLKTGNLVLDVKASSKKLSQISAKMEAYKKDARKAESTMKGELHALQMLEHDIDVHAQEIKAQKAIVATAAAMYDKMNKKTVTECDKAKSSVCDALSKWLRLYPLIHQSSIVEEPLLASLDKTASCQGLVAEWRALRQLSKTFALIADEYSPVAQDCHNLAQAQQEKLRHLSKFCNSLNQRVETVNKNCTALETAIKDTENLSKSLQSLLRDLSLALDKDLEESLAEAEAACLASATTMEEAAAAAAAATAGASGADRDTGTEEEMQQDDGGTAPRNPHAAHTHTRTPQQLQRLRTWQWCKLVEVLRTPELEAVQQALSLASDVSTVLGQVPVPPPAMSGSGTTGGGDAPPAASDPALAQLFTRHVLLGLETRRCARELQWAAAATAHEAVRKITAAISAHQASSSSVAIALQAGAAVGAGTEAGTGTGAGAGAGAGAGPSHPGLHLAPPAESLERFFEWCAYQSTAGHLSLALGLDGRGFPCSPETLHRTACWSVLGQLREAELAGSAVV